MVGDLLGTWVEEELEVKLSTLRRDTEAGS